MRTAVIAVGSILGLSLLGRIDVVFGAGFWPTTLTYFLIVAALLYWAFRKGVPTPADFGSWEGESRIAAMIVGLTLTAGGLFRLLVGPIGYQPVRLTLFGLAGAAAFVYYRRARLTRW